MVLTYRSEKEADKALEVFEDLISKKKFECKVAESLTPGLRFLEWKSPEVVKRAAERAGAGVEMAETAKTAKNQGEMSTPLTSSS